MPTDFEFSMATMATRRRALGRKLGALSIRLQSEIGEIAELLDVNFLSEAELEVLTKQKQGLETITRNLATIGKKLDQ